MENKVILNVRHYKQKFFWSCGPTSLRIILDYYNERTNEKKLIKETGCNEHGTYIKNIKRFLRKDKYKYYEKENAVVGDLKRFIKKGILVIVAYNAHHDSHYSVVVGYDKNRILVADPYSIRKYVWISNAKFIKKWKSEDEPGKIVKK